MKGAEKQSGGLFRAPQGSERKGVSVRSKAVSLESERKIPPSPPNKEVVQSTAFLFGGMKRSLREHEVGSAYEDATLMKCCCATIRNALLRKFAKRICFILRNCAMLHIDEVDASFHGTVANEAEQKYGHRKIKSLLNVLAIFTSRLL